MSGVKTLVALILKLNCRTFSIFTREFVRLANRVWMQNSQTLKLTSLPVPASPIVGVGTLCKSSQ